MTLDPELLRERAASALLAARDRTRLLTTCVEGPDLVAQHSPLMSPLVWDLAHIGNQEEQWLLRTVGGRDALRPDIDSVYDAFEHPAPSAPPSRCSRRTKRTAMSPRSAAGCWTSWSALRCTAGRCSTPDSPSA